MGDSRLAAVIGAGPAGLMAAEQLTRAGIEAHIFDAMPSFGRKFLMAGKSGLNITHAEDLNLILNRYLCDDPKLRDIIRTFPPKDIMCWMKGLGIESYTGSSGRVFPTMMKASPLLRAWVARLKEQGAVLHRRHRWTGWNEAGELTFDISQPQDMGVEQISYRPSVTVFGLGGASWRRLGSDGHWATLFSSRHIPLAPFHASNIGFTANWSDHLKENFAGAPVKAVRLTVKGDGPPISTQSEFVLTPRGVEGGGIYLLSTRLREQLTMKAEAELIIDLTPDVDEDLLALRLSNRRLGESTSNYLRKAARLTGVKKALLYECTPKAVLDDPAALAKMIKALPVRLNGMAPMDEAISTGGGVKMEALNDDLMLRQLPGIFCAGEMLDWDTVTGGYLLTACLATGRRAGEGAANWLLDRSASDRQNVVA